MSSPDATETPLRGQSNAALPGAPQLPWQRALIFLSAAWIVTLLLYWDTTASLVETWWRSPTYAHGFVIAPISLYLAWRRRQELQRLCPTPSWAAVLIFGLAAVIWLAGSAANALSLQQLGVILMLQALVPVLLGWTIARSLLFPLAYLLFVWPVGEGLVPILQDITAWFVVKGLQLTDIPVIQEGRYILIPNGSFEVAEACSGIRYLMAAFSLGTVYAYLSYRSSLKRVSFAALSIIVPIVANGIRAYGIVMIAYLTDMRWAVGVDHLIYGWLFFGLVMLVLFLLGHLWQDPPARTSDGSRPIGPSALDPRGSRVWPVTVGALLVASMGPLYTGAGSYLRSPETSVRIDILPLHGWTEIATDDPGWRPRFVGADRELRMVSGNGEHRIDLYVAAYAHQRQGAEMINSENHIYDPDRWRRISDQRLEWLTPDRDPQEVQETAVAGSKGQLIIWHWYEVGDEVTASALVAKVLESKAALLGAQAPSCVIALAAPWYPGEEHPRGRLEHEAHDLYQARSAVCQSGPDQVPQPISAKTESRSR